MSATSCSISKFSPLDPNPISDPVICQKSDSMDLTPPAYAPK